MKSDAAISVPLHPAVGVTLLDGAYVSNMDLPWLRIELDNKIIAGQWIEIVYASGLIEPLVRPILRSIRDDGYRDAILPGALFGRGIWAGLIPEGTQELWISPADRPGRFSFAIESLRILSRSELVWRAIRRAPRYALAGIGAHAVGLPYVAETQFRRALLPIKLEDYDDWREARLLSQERPRDDAIMRSFAKEPEIRFVTRVEPENAKYLEALIDQLRGQSFPHWTLTAIQTPPSEREAGLLALSAKSQITIMNGSLRARALIDGLSPSDLIAPIELGDEIPAFALAVLAEAARADPDADIFYGDEDTIDRNGKHSTPKLKPDWSPIFYEAVPYLGSAVFFRATLLRQVGDETTAKQFALDPKRVTRHLIQSDTIVKHIRRIMRSCRRPSASLWTADQPSSVKNHPRNITPSGKPRATIIIPTKDSCHLLQSCVESLNRTIAFEHLEIIIVDNGSVRSDTKKLLGELSHRNGFRLLSRPEPFNFSKLCNEAAHEADAGTLVFLNNDTEIIQNDWLERLLVWVRRPEVGAVGARLLYPNRLLQHAGVVLGTDGCAGHFQRMSASDDSGYFGRIHSPHEVSAVSAACLAIEKCKFDSAGGFDARNLPIEFNDIDLCLRLAERGWQTICAADSHLIHHESASRGASLRTDELYSREHRYFRQRWIHKLRDDPYFHPALSLDTLDAALG